MDIFLSHTLHGKPVLFVARSWGEARTRAHELAGKRHRGITIIHPTNPLYRIAVLELGLAN